MAALWLLVSPSAAHAQAKADSPLGSLFTPRHVPDTTPEDVLQALLETASIGGHISYMWEWASGEPGIAHAEQLMPYFRALGLKTFIQLNPTGIGEPAPPDGLAKSFADPAVRERYLSDVRRMAALQPDYLNLAAEINLVHYLNLPEFEAFQTLYVEAYEAAKELSPSTQIGVSYHLDLFFGDTSEFALVETLGPQDFIGFTTYPAWTVYKGFYTTIDDIPEVYYSRIRSVIPDRPIVFSEVGWPSGGRGTPEDQAAFVRRMPALLGSVQPALVTWTMLHDVNHFRVEYLNDAQIAIIRSFDLDPAELFAELNSMGLLSWDGPPKPAFIEAGDLVFAPEP